MLEKGKENTGIQDILLRAYEDDDLLLAELFFSPLHLCCWHSLLSDHKTYTKFFVLFHSIIDSFFTEGEFNKWKTFEKSSHKIK